MSDTDERFCDVNGNGSNGFGTCEENGEDDPSTSDVGEDRDVIVSTETVKEDIHGQANETEGQNTFTQSSSSDVKSLKKDLSKLKADYRASLEREDELSIKLKKFDLQTVRIAELDILNEELREQLNESLKECAGLRKDLERYEQDVYNLDFCDTVLTINSRYCNLYIFLLRYIVIHVAWAWVCKILTEFHLLYLGIYLLVSLCQNPRTVSTIFLKYFLIIFATAHPVW